jgi:peptide-methionine (R)-S-oxide reductase
MSSPSRARPIAKPAKDWKAELSPEAYRVTREHGTERAFSHPYHDEKAAGTYRCVGCGEALFASSAKFESGTGWPSYFEPVAPEAVGITEDRSFFMRRTEVHCATCDAHLGHVFPDGPKPTGQRYCINGVALKLETKSKP